MSRQDDQVITVIRWDSSFGWNVVELIDLSQYPEDTVNSVLRKLQARVITEETVDFIIDSGQALDLRFVEN